MSKKDFYSLQQRICTVWEEYVCAESNNTLSTMLVM
jgi:hypothetical protein